MPPFCAPMGEGLDTLKNLLVSFAPKDGAESSMLSQARHVQAALRACDSLTDAQRAIDDGMTLDMCAVDLSAALDALGIRELTPEALRQTAGFILKNSEDIAAIQSAQEPSHACNCGHHGGHHHG